LTALAKRVSGGLAGKTIYVGSVNFTGQSRSFRTNKALQGKISYLQCRL